MATIQKSSKLKSFDWVELVKSRLNRRGEVTISGIKRLSILSDHAQRTEK